MESIPKPPLNCAYTHAVYFTGKHLTRETALLCSHRCSRIFFEGEGQHFLKQYQINLL